MTQKAYIAIKVALLANLIGDDGEEFEVAGMRFRW